ncbi:MAG TPA: hypothetical protein VEA59_02595 [Patescibacteria group bacterium]|nr:hypothetical protein [Patescibacteria group bacterium]
MFCAQCNAVISVGENFAYHKPTDSCYCNEKHGQAAGVSRHELSFVIVQINRPPSRHEWVWFAVCGLAMVCGVYVLMRIQSGLPLWPF